MKVKEAKKIS